MTGGRRLLVLCIIVIRLPLHTCNDEYNLSAVLPAVHSRVVARAQILLNISDKDIMMYIGSFNDNIVIVYPRFECVAFHVDCFMSSAYNVYRV